MTNGGEWLTKQITVNAGIASTEGALVRWCGLRATSSPLPAAETSAAEKLIRGVLSRIQPTKPKSVT